MTLQEFFNWAQPLLEKSGITNARQELFWLLEEWGGFAKTALLLKPQSVLEEALVLKLTEGIDKRAKRVPLQYILGKAEFLNWSFRVGPGVLIPRPETELLTHWAAANAVENCSVLEIGSGSGCLSIALALARPDLTITASDISSTALHYTRLNAGALLPPSARFHALFSDVFSHIEGKYQLILSNPPYLTAEDMLAIAPELTHEPSLALSPGEDGLALYRKIASQASDFLLPGGYIALEIGYNIYEPVLALFKNYQHIKTLHDYAHIPRVVIFQFP
ncbi:MAG: peptide chain release factor N(5)-glutamine methyltransferase [Spirochaetae bacterium HGW-Spirochaetae-6]|nr:MAG: peptide chain release factor N(5)-glutamine methyltransferase [Spirochaetae bacterium HGW-Spirochaetae-6]